MSHMKKIIFVIILLVVVLSIISYIYFQNYQFCTKKLCPCTSATASEIPCNDCGIINPVFITGIFNIVKACSAKEIVICDSSNKIGQRYDIDYSSCKNALYLFIIPVYR